LREPFGESFGAFIIVTFRFANQVFWQPN